MRGTGAGKTASGRQAGVHHLRSLRDHRTVHVLSAGGQNRAPYPTAGLLHYFGKPNNQFYFWPEYRYPDHRKGENAIYVTEPGTASLESGWFWKWLTGKEVLVAREPKPVFRPATVVATV